MQKKRQTITRMGVLFITLFLAGVFLVLPGRVCAGSKPTPIEGIGYNVNTTITDNLKALTGKRVSIYLDSGTVVTGVVKGIGTHLIHIEKLKEKNFFDALIQIDRIIGIDTQFRKY